MSLLTARCLGACGLAPAVVFDGDVSGKLTGDGMKDRVRQYLQTESKAVGVGA
ncbi:MAG TPA: NAD(P)H-dependent oxidoreductase subunit E [candidate division Zixibacteria bacterium]|nr:NAD(P)H-dependent oxidoreductase subunit E [candidate division Zixibacteria bacterium]